MSGANLKDWPDPPQNKLMDGEMRSSTKFTSAVIEYGLMTVSTRS